MTKHSDVNKVTKKEPNMAKKHPPSSRRTSALTTTQSPVVSRHSKPNLSRKKSLYHQGNKQISHNQLQNDSSESYVPEQVQDFHRSPACFKDAVLQLFPKNTQELVTALGVMAGIAYYLYMRDTTLLYLFVTAHSGPAILPGLQQLVPWNNPSTKKPR